MKKNTRRFSKVFNDVSLTKQAFRDDSDINRIVGRYSPSLLARARFSCAGGVDDDVPVVDNTQFSDFHELQNRLVSLSSSFGSLPSKLRDRFSNDPRRLLLFISDPRNFDEGVALGLFAKPKTKRPHPVSGSGGEDEDSKKESGS